MSPEILSNEVIRCDRCRWWRIDGVGRHDVNVGDCMLFTVTKRRSVHEGAKLTVTSSGGEAVCSTDADFGCVQFQAKDSLTRDQPLPS